MYIYNTKTTWDGMHAWIKTSKKYNNVKNFYVKVNNTWKPVWKYEWEIGGWSACSASCGGGVQTRTVNCIRLPHYPNYILRLEDRFCFDITPKPATTQPCNTHSCTTYIYNHSGRHNGCNRRWFIGTFYNPIHLYSGGIYVSDMCGRNLKIYVETSKQSHLVHDGNPGVCDDYDTEYRGSIGINLNYGYNVTYDVYIRIVYPGKNNCCDGVEINSIGFYYI